MKLNKNFVQISTTAIITAFAILIPMTTHHTGLFRKPPIQSSRITWTQANTMHNEYLSFKPMRVQVPENSSGTIANLKGFSFSASQLDEIINGNLSGSKPDQVYFMFGQEGTFNDGFMNNSANMRIIAVGSLNNSLLTTPRSGTSISVYDKADPCPPNCPN